MPKTSPAPESAATTGKRARTREQILDAALGIVASRGLQEVPILDLATAAGVSNGTFYNHFPSREALLEAVALRLAESLATELRPLLGSTADPAARVALASGRFMARAEADTEFGWALLRLTGAHAPLSALISQYILSDLAEGQRQGRFHFVSEQAALDLLLGTLLAGIRSVLEGRAGREHYAHIAEVTLCGLGVERKEARTLSALAAHG